MPKVKYYYDPKTLSYLPIENSTPLRISNFLLFLVSSTIFGAILLFILLNTSWLSTPTEIVQQRELNNYELQFDILNRRLMQIESVLENVEDRDNNLYRVYFEASPIPEAQRRVGFGGVNRYKELEGFDNSDLIVNTTKRIDVLTKQIVVQSQSLAEIEELAKDKEDLLEAIPSIQPVRNEDLIRMASGYGYRTDPFTKKRKMHYGMDFTASRGTPIYASGNGVVKRADNRSAGYGKHIRIDHGFGYVSLYAHLNKYNVKRGQKVKRGDIIGYVGSTGRSVGPHLHYEILKDGRKINPLNFYYGQLSAAEFDKLLNQASQENQSLD
ncbi:MAG TPA: peptidase M23 [Flavobacteriaceae bacterium]|nr:MAG: Murein DD-endopeptidase MepM [Flavobacteriaceae bacterium]HCQ24365.1 peptidase M23 [Flavobacteriaceae bacterium]|tara:strand:+ start:173 stop:1150 length:978 start_codon:yes stop_codon:yes gene_type:complete